MAAMVDYPIEFPTEAIAVVIETFREGGTVTDEGPVQAGWNVLGYALGQTVGPYEPTPDVVAACDCTDDECKAEIVAILEAVKAGELVEHRDGAVVGRPEVNWKRLIALLLRLLPLFI